MNNPVLARPAVYFYAVALFEEEGTPLGRFAADVDFESAVEWARLTRLRAVGDPVEAYTARSTVVPEWDRTLGEPYLEGCRVILSTDSGEECPGQFFSTELFKPVAHAAAARLVEEGTLEEGARFRYRPMAFLQDSTSSPRGQPGFLSKPSPPHIPLEPGAISDFYGREGMRCGTGEDGIPLFIPETVLGQATALAVSAGEVETGGVLLGFLRRDPEAGDLFVEVSAQLPAEYAEGTSTSLSFNPEAWTAVRAALELRNRGEIMVGWWHSHVQNALCPPDCTEEERATCRFRENFFSHHDHALHRTVFPRAYSVALVVNVVTEGPPTHSLFGWTEGMIRPRILHPSAEVSAAAIGPAR